MPDRRAAFELMEKEYKHLLQQQYILHSQVHMSLKDMDSMTSEDRLILLDFLKEQREAEAEAQKGTQSAPPSLPSQVEEGRHGGAIVRDSRGG